MRLVDNSRRCPLLRLLAGGLSAPPTATEILTYDRRQNQQVIFVGSKMLPNV
jgi:hypothetical protein